MIKYRKSDGGGGGDLKRIRLANGGPCAGDVVLFRSADGFFNRRIVGYQELIGFGYPASIQVHVGIMFDGDLVMGATTPKSSLKSIKDNYQGRIKTYLRPKEVYLKAECRNKPLKWALSRSNLNYGWLSLLGFYIALATPVCAGNPLSNHNAPYCSMLIAWAFRKTGVDPFPGVATSLVTPAHFFESEFFEIIQ